MGDGYIRTNCLCNYSLWSPAAFGLSPSIIPLWTGTD